MTAVVAHIFHGLWPNMVGGGGEGGVRQKRLLSPPFGRIHCQHHLVSSSLHSPFPCPTSGGNQS